MAQNITYLGTYEGTYPNTNTTTKPTAYDWLNTILKGASNILDTLFPSGLNNSGQGQYPSQYPYPQPQTSSNNNLILYVVIGFGVLYFLTKDK